MRIQKIAVFGNYDTVVLAGNLSNFTVRCPFFQWEVVGMNRIEAFFANKLGEPIREMSIYYEFHAASLCTLFMFDSAAAYARQAKMSSISIAG